MVQWVRLHTPKGPGSIPGQGTILPRVITKTRNSQINKKIKYKKSSKFLLTTQLFENSFYTHPSFSYNTCPNAALSVLLKAPPNNQSQSSCHIYGWLACWRHLSLPTSQPLQFTDATSPATFLGFLWDSASSPRTLNLSSQNKIPAGTG